MIDVRKLNKQFNHKNVLHDVSIKAYPGEVYGFLGHNGAGKTTTMQIVCGLSPFDSGEVVLASKNIGFVPEAPVFYETLSLMEYLKLISHSSEKKNTTADLEALCELVKLSKFKNNRIVRFSRGMKQRAAIAAALINDPDILLLDEPTSALDPEGRADVMGIIGALKKQGKTILLSTHILSDVESLCDRVGILKEGHMLYEGTVEALHAAHPQTAIDVLWVNNDVIQYTPSQNLLRALGSLGRLEAHSQGISLHVIDTENGMKSVLKCLTEHDAYCHSVAIKKLSLEDIYMGFEREVRHDLD